MSLRIAFDLDGVLADFESAYRETESRLFGASDHQARVPGQDDEIAPTEPAAAAGQPRKGVVRSERRELKIWRAIEATTNFWETLEPIDARVVPRIQELATRYRWEVFFITQRPDTAGDAVQRQSQRWLIRQGFELPSVLVLKHSRGRLADALQLDYVVDDSAKNCVDVISESRARALLVLRHEKEHHSRPTKARGLGIGVVPSIAACLDLLDEIESVRSNPTLFDRVARMVGWKTDERS